MLGGYLISAYTLLAYRHLVSIIHSVSAYETKLFRQGRTFCCSTQTNLELHSSCPQHQHFFMLLAFLELILRVRQACCHAGLVPAERRENATHVLDIIQKSKGGELPPDLAEDLLAALRGVRESEQLHECVVCRNELEEESTMILRECKHIFCEACLNSIQNQVCPMCRVPYGPDDMISKKTAEASAKPAAKSEVKNATRDVKNSSKLGRSPKVQALLDEIDKMAPDEKGVIFSQWTSFLDIIEIELSKEGHTYTRVDGTMSADRRVEAMEDFDTEGCDSMKTPRFILCSLMACGTFPPKTKGSPAATLNAMM